MVQESLAGFNLTVFVSFLVLMTVPSSGITVASDADLLVTQWATAHCYDLEAGRSAWRPVLVIDSANVPHGVFIDMWSTESSTTRYLSYLTGSGSTWLAGSIPGTEDASSFSIAIDGSDNLHMCAAVHGELRYFMNYEEDSSYLVVEEVSADCCKVVVDDAGVVHILYLDTELSAMKHARLMGEEWSVESVEDVSIMDSVALMGDGTVHGCYASDSGSMVYFTNASGDWEFETVDHECEVQLWSAMVASLSDGTPVLSYGDLFNENVKLAYRIDGEWHVFVAAPDAGYPSMAVNQHDDLVLIYLSGSSVFVKTYSGGYSLLALNSYNQIGSPTAVTTDAEGYAHVLYRYSRTLSDHDSSVEIDDLVYATNSLDVPAGPRVLSLSAERGGLRLSWDADGGIYATGITGYTIYRGETDGAQTYLATVDASKLTYLDESVVAGTDYFYRVTAFNDEGESLFEHAAAADTVDWDWRSGMSLSDYGLLVASAVVAVLVIIIIRQRGKNRSRKDDTRPNGGQGSKEP